jgi:hypothetical protein
VTRLLGLGRLATCASPPRTTGRCWTADHLLVRRSPRGWEHINLTGDYTWVGVDQVTKNPDGFQLLRPPSVPSRIAYRFTICPPMRQKSTVRSLGPGLAAGSRTRGEALEERGAWSGLPQSVAPSHAPVDRTLRFLPLDCAVPSRLDDRTSHTRAVRAGGTVMAHSPRQSDLRPSAAGAADRHHRARGVHQPRPRGTAGDVCAAACAAMTPIAGDRHRRT